MPALDARPAEQRGDVVVHQSRDLPNHPTGDSTTVTLSNIQVTDPDGSSATGYEVITADAETIDPGGYIKWASSLPASKPLPFNLVPNFTNSDLGNACNNVPAARHQWFNGLGHRQWRHHRPDRWDELHGSVDRSRHRRRRVHLELADELALSTNGHGDDRYHATDDRRSGRAGHDQRTTKRRGLQRSGLRTPAVMNEVDAGARLLTRTSTTGRLARKILRRPTRSLMTLAMTPVRPFSRYFSPSSSSPSPRWR